METDFWAHEYLKNPPKEEIEDEDFDQDAVMREWENNPDDWETII